jgi:type III pantothenate kinase
MLLTIDIGNSSTKFGIFEGKNLSKRFTIPTIKGKSADDIYDSIQDEIKFQISGIIISSVVTELEDSFRDLSEKHFGQKPFFVHSGLDFGFSINYNPPESVGADRLTAAFAAVKKYGKPCIVCDFGTATNIEVVNSQNVYIGGVIAPGISTFAEALFIKTSKLPRVEIRKTEKVIENSTISCIQSGIFHGYIGLVEGIISRMTKELGEKPEVIATGGFASLMAENCSLIKILDEDLMLDGLRLIYEKRQRQNAETV